MPRDLMKYFRAEARELLTRLSGDTLSFEAQPTADLLARMLRNAHTLKGAARVVDQPAIATAIHRYEGLLTAHRQSPESFPKEDANQLLACLDEIAVQVAALESGSPAESPGEPPPPAASSPRSPGEDGGLGLLSYPGLEVDALLEDLRAAAGGIEVLRRNLQSVERGKTLGELLLSQLAGDSAPKSARFVAEELQAQLRGVERNLAFGVDMMERELRQVQESTEKLRLVRAEALFPVLRRVLRDACGERGRQAELVTAGGELRLEPQLLGAVQGALIQAMRNSVAHGIEDPVEREKLAKPRVGQVSLEIARQGRYVVFRCRDDGRGVDLEGVRRRLLGQGVAARELDTGGLLRALLQGGVSTAETVTQTAGRGIGLDLIRETASLQGGEVQIETAAGRFTELVLRLPWSVAGGDFLEVAAFGAAEDEIPARLLLPLDNVKAALRLQPADISREGGGETIVHESQAIPLLSLDDLLGSPSSNGPMAAVVLRSAQGPLALAVGSLKGTRVASLLPLPRWARAAAYVAGAALDADGNAELVLDPEGLLEATRQNSGGRPGQLGRPAGRDRAGATSLAENARLLVIDDSLTTRMLQQSILESAGFQVDLASSAEEGLEKARQRRYGLILCDVEMPGMDGFAFVERIRREPDLGQVPTILVTSRDAPEDKLRGQRVGAQGYMVKSEFDQKDLLRQIRGLLA